MTKELTVGDPSTFEESLRAGGELMAHVNERMRLIMGLQQLTAKYKILRRACGHLSPAVLRVWAESLGQQPDFVGLVALCRSLADSLEFIERYDADIKKIKEEIHGE